MSSSTENGALPRRNLRARRILFSVAGAILTLILLLLTIAAALLVSAGFISVDARYVERISNDAFTDPGITAFTHVNIVDVNDSERLLLDYTVLIDGREIVEVAPADLVSVPDHATVIDSTDRYLIPGLTDAHVHIKDEDELLLYVAAGVTTVRDMWGTTGLQLTLGFPDQLEMQARTAEGSLLGPSIYTTGPIMEGVPATNPLLDTYTSPQAAVESVQWQAAQGYQFIKVYDHLSPEVYAAITTEAERHALPVVGHVPYAVGLDMVIASNQHSIEHLTGFVDSEAAALLVPEDQLMDYARQIADAGIWNCPTLVLYTRVLPATELTTLQNQPEMRYMPRWLRALWPFFTSQIRAELRYTGDDYPDAINRVNFQVMAALHDAGARFIAGTDTDNPFLIPGFSLHDELEVMVDAGLSPYEVLQAATVNAADALGAPGEFGAITPGQRADLVLLSDNPLVDITNIRLQEGVMLRGKWFNRQQLDTMLEELSRSYNPTLIDWMLPTALGAAMLFSLFVTVKLFRRRR